MSAKSVINKEVFIPHDEKMLAAVQVKRRTKKKIPFLATGGQGDYMTFICSKIKKKCMSPWAEGVHAFVETFDLGGEHPCVSIKASC
uniref:Syntaxin binding protein 6 (amisyn) n=1 Tax=Pundamilia nyererei TaxID=303518 RepID=A0A3B4GIC8_9CICH